MLEEEAEANERHFNDCAAQFNQEQAELFQHLRSKVDEPDGECIFVDVRTSRGKSLVLQAFVS